MWMQNVVSIRGVFGVSGSLLLCLAMQAGTALADNSPSKKTPAASSANSDSHSSKKTSSHKKSSSKNKKSAKKRGQQVIEPERAKQIQAALIREHYMGGEPSGKWDESTQAAMQRYQSDQGWQSKTTPDSRALIKLGLGPSSDGLLNPESAMTTAPAANSRKSGPADPSSKMPSDAGTPQR
jgi:peptidoglycan hydrolase-like protein with peptidoglycan-binding domain